MRRRIGVEVAVLFPKFIPAFLRGGVIVLLGKFVGGSGRLIHERV
jgi:hypothetical protein